MLHISISTTHDAATASADCQHALLLLSPSLPQTVIYHGVFIEHAPASHLIIIMERRVELLSPLINVRPADRTYVCVTAVAGCVATTAGDASPSLSASGRRLD